MSLNKELVLELSKPFSGANVKWKIQTNPSDKMAEEAYAVVVPYIDARDVSERLDIATSGDWFDLYSQPPVGVFSLLNESLKDKISTFLELECSLTVCGVTRKDVGCAGIQTLGNNQFINNKNLELAMKDLYSDAFKRAAVKFGVGRYLTSFPTVRALVHKAKFGDGYYIQTNVEKELDMFVDYTNAGEQLPRFEQIQIFGYMSSTHNSSDSSGRNAESDASNSSGGSRSVSNTEVCEDLISKINKLWLEEKKLGGDCPKGEVNLDISNWTEQNLRSLGRKVEARVNVLKSTLATTA